MTVAKRIVPACIVSIALLAHVATAAQEKTITVTPGAWVATGIELKRREVFDTTATGTITQNLGTEKRESGPDGYYWIGFQAWTLKYKIGDAKDAFISDLGSNGSGMAGEKGGQLYLGISKTYDPAPDEKVTGSFTVKVRWATNRYGPGGLAESALGGSTGPAGSGLPGAAGSGKGGRDPLSPLIPGMIPPLIAILVNGKKIIPRRPTKPRRPQPKIPFKEDPEDAQPKNPPEPPFVRNNPRDETPQPCLGIYDEYVSRQKEVVGLERDIRIATKHYWEAQRRHNQNLAKFSIQLAWDTSDLAAAGAAGVGGAMGISKLIHEIPALLRQGLQLARAALTKITRKVKVLMEELAAIGRQLTTFGKAAEELAAKAKGLARTVDDLAGAVSTAEKGLAEHLRFVTFLQNADASLAERGAVLRQLTEAEGRLRSAKQALDVKLERKAALPAEQARLASQIGEAAKEAEELAASNLKAEHNAAANTAAKRDPLRRCDNKIRELEPRVKNLEELERRRVALNSAEDALDEADAELKVAEKNAADMEQAVKSQDNWKRLQNELKEATEFEAGARVRLEDLQAKLMQCRKENALLVGSVPVDAEGMPILTAAQKAEHNRLQRLENYLMSEVTAAADFHTKTKFELDAATHRARALPEDLPAIVGADLTQSILAARAELAAAKAKVVKLHGEWEQATKNFQPFSHRGMNPADLPRMQSELAEQKQLFPGLKSEFDEAWNAEQLVKTQLQDGQAKIAALRSKQGELEGALKKAEAELATIADDEAKFDTWRPEIDGQIAEHKGKVADLDKKISDLQAKVPGGATKESLQQEISKLHGDIAENKKKLSVAKEQQTQVTDSLNNARRVAASAQADEVAKRRDLRSAEEEQAAAEREVKRLEQEIENRLKNPDLIDQARQKSKEWSDAVKPRIVKSLEDAFKGGLNKVGGVWHKLFNGQSPEEIADILVKGRDAVKQLLDELNDLLRYRDELMQELRRLRGELEQCRIQNGGSTLR